MPRAAIDGFQRPWSYVPSMALFQSLVFCFVSVLPGLFLKSLGAGNELVGLASIFALPIAFRFLAGIAVDRGGNIRTWSLVTQLLSTATAVAAALSLLAGAPLGVTLGLIALAGVIAAFQDVATDGFFLFSLRPAEKAFYCNLKLQVYRVGILVGQGLYVMLAGRLILAQQTPSESWGRVFLLHAGVLAALLAWNVVSFPANVSRVSSEERTTTFACWRRMIVEFVRMPGMVWTLAFIALFRAGESVLTAMKAPFLLDPIASGGLGLSLQDVGFLNGVLVFGFSILGGIAGGVWVQRKGLKRTLGPAVLLLNLPNAVFFWLAVQPPQAGGTFLGLHVSWEVIVCLVAEGVANSLALAPSIYLLIVCAQGRHRATLFAFASGVMNLGWTLPGTVSGFLQQAMGYPALFLALTLAGLPAVWLIRRMPLGVLEASPSGAAEAGDA